MGTSALSVSRLIQAYSTGYFPMAERRDSPVLFWFNPPRRGVLPIDGFHVPGSLKRFMRKGVFETRVDTAFEAVMQACAAIPRSHEDGTWINDEMIANYTALHALGHAHSVESWYEGELVGGLYGVSLGGAFFGESMFSEYSEASKVALVQLVAILKEAGYSLLDTQFVNEHLLQFGVEEIAKNDYLDRLENALKQNPNPSSLFSTISVRKGFATASVSS